jgi:coenzyme PQQ biosynthesis protein PqqD
MVTLDAYPIPNPAVQGRRLDNEAVLVLPERGEVKVLNEVGALIWQLADGTRTVAEIVTSVCAEYQVSQTQAEADVLEFIDELQAKAILSVR